MRPEFAHKHLGKYELSEQVKKSVMMIELKTPTNQVLIQRKIDEMIQKHELFTAIYLDIDNLKIFNKVYGYDQGNRAVNLLIDIARDTAKHYGNQNDQVTHLGGDNVLVLSSQQKAKILCEQIISDFDLKKRCLYTDEDRLRDYMVYENPSGLREQYPLMTLSIAVVTNKRGELHNYLGVIDTALEQLAYFRQFPGSKSYFEINRSDINSPDAAVYGKREAIGNMNRLLSWLDFCMDGIMIPLKNMDEDFKILEGEVMQKRYSDSQIILRDFHEQLLNSIKIVEANKSFINTDCPFLNDLPEEIKVIDCLNWVKDQLQTQTLQKCITIDIQGDPETATIIVDGKSLAQSLLYLLESTINSGGGGDHLQISVSAKNKHYTCIKISNDTSHINDFDIDSIFLTKSCGCELSRIYLSRSLLQSIGGRLITSGNQSSGITYTIIIPQKWHGSLKEVNALLLAVDISRRQAREETRNLHNLTESLIGGIPQKVQHSFDVLRDHIQELTILCNRALYLAENYSSQMETRNSRWLEQELERILTLELLITICDDTKPLGNRRIFDLKSSRRVADYALPIASELRMSLNERQIIRYASLLKDFGLVLSERHITGKLNVSKFEDMAIIQSRFTRIREALSRVPFIKEALDIVFFSYEKYNGANDKFANTVPLSARVLAFARDLEDKTSNMLSDKTNLDCVVRSLATESGGLYDPDVVNAFLLAWKKQEVRAAQANLNKEVIH
jgi:response regulator RpfG family c-di-GMP phosphodiesterase/GGDEF domain-containing protein